MNKARLALVAAAVVLSSAAADAADPRQDLVDGMARCATIADGAARLSCYDALNPTLKAAQAAPALTPQVAAAPPAQTADSGRPWYDPLGVFGTAPSAQTRPEQFGGENLAPPAPPPSAPGEPPPPPAPVALDSITAEVTDYSFNPNTGRFVVFLDNGQIWRQIEGDSDRAHFYKTQKNVVVIERGVMGSYDMHINGLSRGFKVRREK